MLSRICLSLVLLTAPLLHARELAPPIDVQYTNGAVKLTALLIRPEGEGPFPAAVIVQGSGTSDRTNRWARAAAELLAQRGIAVLLTDKRGSGTSGGDWRTASFDDLAGDALSGVAFLRGRPEIAAQRIGLIGLSQGGWIVPVAAAKSYDVAYVIVFSGAGVSFAEQTMVEIANTSRQVGLTEAETADIVALNRATGRYIASGNWQPYAALRTRLLNGRTKPVAEGFPDSPASPMWGFLRKVALHDPLPYWATVEQPVFFAFGEEDEHDNLPVAESVRRLEWVFKTSGKRNYEIVVAPGVGHGLCSKELVFAPAVVDRLDTWLSELR